ncbi:glycosyltransferase (plasmid) [Pseudorhodobacter turbinis]|uniref:Glycosyltransferase n=1 Tax=Pseudorhodobacter turbinis TaxID=2500533 RepID=A0A4P8EM48_9RHOB|nr:glycosyltransferase [Pseudorhodobacter turbinis]QCO58157.1 glycosyltransferase [Pseudorhodobacter turbinis]
MTETANFPVTVSVITPARNAADVLARAVASVQAQTFADWEMIIVDDGSSDMTAALAQTLAQSDPRLQVLCHATGTGAAKARNTAIKAARGRYIAFLDADDAWVPEKLAQQLRVMRDRQAGLSYTGFMRLSASGQRQVQVPKRVTRAELLLGNCIGCSTVIYDRAMLGTVLMPDLPMRQDYALWLTLLARLPYAVGVDAPLVSLYTTPGSLSSNKWRAMRATWAMHHRHFETGPFLSALYVASHTLRRLRRG